MSIDAIFWFGEKLLKEFIQYIDIQYIEMIKICSKQTISLHITPLKEV